MFFSKKLSKFQNLKHCFFSRKNGFSKGIYKSLNCGPGSNDNKKNIIKNLKIVSKKIGCKEKSLVTLNQTHSNKVIYCENEKDFNKRLNADAVITTVKNVAISILTADCVPILFYDTNKKIIACAHAGWKGALNGIVTNTINQFFNLESKIDDLVVAVGPSIKKDSYEVGIDLYKKFINHQEASFECFKKIENEKYLFDLRRYINMELQNLNIKKVDNIDLDTFSDEKNFFSYRRSLVNKEKDYGRCISVILMT